jgi:phosphatidylserine decarboxylase
MILLAFVCGAAFVVRNDTVRGCIFGVAIVMAFLIANFFRDPDRRMPKEQNIVVAPADGKVVVIKELFEGEYLKQDAVQVSIFMSPLNVHVNRFPISGTVEYFKHYQGEYLVAFNEKASELNERTVVGIGGEGYKVLFKQIAGAVARRIVAPISIGQTANAGERCGMIKFGSRVDVLMPKGTQVKVAMGDKVVAGESIIASYTAIAGKNV